MPSLLGPLRQGRFGLLVGGLVFSAVGDQLYLVVLTWIAVGLFGPAAGYLVSLKAFVVLLTALGAGGLLDRVTHRRAMAAADIFRAGALTLVVAAWLRTGAPSATLIVIAVVVLAVGEAAFRPALRASVPGLIVARALLPPANALIDSAERIARLLGPALVALLVALVAPVDFLTIDAASFVVSAACVLLAVRGGVATLAATGKRPPALAEALRGFRVVARHRVLLWTLLASGPTNGGWYGALFLAVPVLLAGVSPGTSGLGDFGIVIASYGATNLVSMLVVGSRRLPQRLEHFIFPGTIIVGVGIVLMGALGMAGLPPHWLVPALAAAAALSAIGGPLNDIPTATLLQTSLAPSDIAAAVRAFMVSANLGLLIGLALIPPLIAAIGPPATIIVCGIVQSVAGLTGCVMTFGEGRRRWTAAT